MPEHFGRDMSLERKFLIKCIFSREFCRRRAILNNLVCYCYYSLIFAPSSYPLHSAGIFSNFLTTRQQLFFLFLGGFFQNFSAIIFEASNKWTQSGLYYRHKDKKNLLTFSYLRNICFALFLTSWASDSKIYVHFFFSFFLFYAILWWNTGFVVVWLLYNQSNLHLFQAPPGGTYMGH